MLALSRKVGEAIELIDGNERVTVTFIGREDQYGIFEITEAETPTDQERATDDYREALW